MAEITQEELNERVAILKRFRTLLEEQRGKFKEYLNVLEKQHDSITSENTEALLAHTELEQQVVKNLVNLQKVIVPMNKLYTAGKVPSANEAEEIAKIQEEVSELQNKVINQNKINRDLLKLHLESLKTQIKNFQNPYKNNRNVYAKQANVARLVEVEA
ncbi:MAG: flagellar export chaperone FlgN [Treponema sp.]|nr:flagellar export chaperone FlgN [Treponema sp.]